LLQCLEAAGCTRGGKLLSSLFLHVTVALSNRRAPQGVFKLFNRICQYLPKGRMVSFDDFRKLLVNGVALRSNSLVRLLTSEQL
jgi:hypothetical protein